MGHGGSPDFTFPAFYAGGIPVNGNIGDTDALRNAVFNVDTGLAGSSTDDWALSPRQTARVIARVNKFFIAQSFR